MNEMASRYFITSLIFLFSIRSVYVVKLDRLVLEVFVEPVQDVLQPFDAMPRRARTRQFVRLVREPDPDGRNLSVLQGAEHYFAAVGGRRAVIGLALDEHHRRRDVFDVGDRRAFDEIFGVLPRRAAEPGLLEEREVGRVPEARPICYRALRHRRLE